MCSRRSGEENAKRVSYRQEGAFCEDSFAKRRSDREAALADSRRIRKTATDKQMTNQEVVLIHWEVKGERERKGFRRNWQFVNMVEG